VVTRACTACSAALTTAIHNRLLEHPYDNEEFHLQIKDNKYDADKFLSHYQTKSIANKGTL
jgi:hypothetical protein